MKQLLAAATILMCILLAACWGEEDYTLSPHDRLRFSTDTLAFDTVIAGEPTGTRMLDVHNEASKTLRIKAVFLAKGKASLWRVNLDGEFLQGGRTDNVNLLPNDSLRLFAEMTAPLTGQDVPSRYEEQLIFELESGQRQQVVLTAIGQEVTPLRARKITRDTILDARRPYQIFDSLVVAPEATLTLLPGTRLYFRPRASLIVRGRLLSKGTLEHPVVMRGDRLGYMFTQQAYDRIPNQWGGVVLASGSRDNQLDYTDIHSGAYGLRCEPSEGEEALLTLRNSVIHNTKGHALAATNCRIEVGNTQISNAGGDCVHLIGGRARFVHCTLAQFYPFVGARGVALSYTNELHDKPAPLEAHFINCLITGNAADDVQATPSLRYKKATFNYLFQNCLLNTSKVETSAQIVNCLFEDEAPEAMRRAQQFFPSFDLKSLFFSFTLSQKSLAVGKAHLPTTLQWPTDRLGRSRLTDGKADIGCYEAPQQKTKQTDATH